jgi:hypothetical protein
MYKDKMSQTAEEHELPILPQPDVHILLLTKIYTYLYSEILVEEPHHLTVWLTLLE